MIFPSLLKIRVLKSKFNDVAFKNPSHAMLWHRDLDDVFSQLKFIIPLNSTNKENGAFQYISGTNKKISIFKSILKNNIKSILFIAFSKGNAIV